MSREGQGDVELEMTSRIDLYAVHRKLRRVRVRPDGTCVGRQKVLVGAERHARG